MRQREDLTETNLSLKVFLHVVVVLFTMKKRVTARGVLSVNQLSDISAGT